MKNLYTYKHFNTELKQNRKKRRWKNDGSRTIFESAIHEDIYLTLKDWKNSVSSDKYVLIGGLAYSFYVKPRYTEDINLLFLTYDDIPNDVYKFRKHRKHAFEHIKTNVEVEVLTPEHLKEDKELFEMIFETSILSEGIRIASPIGLIAMKLGIFSPLDRADIEILYKYARENDMDLNITKFNLSEEKINRFNEVISSIDETVHNNMYLLEVCSMYEKNKRLKIESELPFDIYVFNEQYGEPRFHIGKGFDRRVKKVNDYMFSISLTDTYKNNSLKVLESSTEYPSFNMFEKEEKLLKKWLSKNNNLEKIKKKWLSINNRKI